MYLLMVNLESRKLSWRGVMTLRESIAHPFETPPVRCEMLWPGQPAHEKSSLFWPKSWILSDVFRHSKQAQRHTISHISFNYFLMRTDFYGLKVYINTNRMRNRNLSQLAIPMGNATTHWEIDWKGPKTWKSLEIFLQENESLWNCKNEHRANGTSVMTHYKYNKLSFDLKGIIPTQAMWSPMRVLQHEVWLLTEEWNSVVLLSSQSCLCNRTMNHNCRAQE